MKISSSRNIIRKSRDNTSEGAFNTLKTITPKLNIEIKKPCLKLDFTWNSSTLPLLWIFFIKNIKRVRNVDSHKIKLKAMKKRDRILFV